MNHLQLFFGFLAGVSVTALYLDFRQRVRSMDERIKKLEDAQRTRMPYEAMEKFLNGMAALDVLENDVDFGGKVVATAKYWFAQALATGTKREKK